MIKMLPGTDDSLGYDFHKPENAEKWRGIFLHSLKKVLEQVHPSLSAQDSALEYVESLCLRLLAMLCAKPPPHTVQDVEERVSRSFPTPIDKWALSDARDTQDKNRRRKSVLPVEKMHYMLQKEVLLYKIDMNVSIFIVAILEYMSADILKLAGNYVKKISQKDGYFVISCQDIKTSMCADKVLMDMFYQDAENFIPPDQPTPPPPSGTPIATSPGIPPPVQTVARRGSLTYAELVRDLISDERQFLRDLHLIIRVFKEELEKIIPKDSKDVELIFGNIVDIYELTVTLLGSLEDAVEMSQDNLTPYVGSCFEELAEVAEFDAYIKYAKIVTRNEAKDALQAIVDNAEFSERLTTAGHGFRLAVKYYLPKLLSSPVAHAFLYFDYVAALLKLAPTHEDHECFEQVESLLIPFHTKITKAIGNGQKIEAALRMASRSRRQLAIERTNELAKNVENWDNKDIGQYCNEFIREDTLIKIGPGKRVAERRAFLFDGLLVLCKPTGPIDTPPNIIQHLKLKEKLYIRKLDVIDRSDTEDMKNVVELSLRCGGSVILSCIDKADKRNWMADLVMLNTKSMLDRTLDSILLDLEKKHPLKLPRPELYKFAVPDSPENIVLEERQNAGGVPPIKGATILKLVERLTFHIYADPALVRTFLTTYRSFCSPSELLNLLIERFNIPDPSLVYDAPAPRIKSHRILEGRFSSPVIGEKPEGQAVSDTEKLSKNTAREDWKRYRKEYVQPVQFRVLNVLRHWVDQHFYDFERDSELLDKLRKFLEGIDGKPMKKWVESVIKIIQRKVTVIADQGLGVGGSAAHVFDRAPPPVVRHVAPPEKHGWHPLALHPLELARQLTLLEFDLYRTVKPSELVGAVWTKKNKETSSPNLLRIIKHTTNFTRWIEKSIIEAENIDERAAIYCRFLETMVALRDLNNFNGVLGVVSAMGTASVYRLKFTYQSITARLKTALVECRELNEDHFRRYQERLRSINPPCVPFCGMYLTNILHIEDGNRDFLPNTELINFSKRRKVAEITGEIQQYQNQPYCLTVEPKLRGFLESLNPFPGMDDSAIRDYLYEKSLQIEPRDIKPAPRFPRKWPELSLKSPGIKPGRIRHNSSSSTPSSSSHHHQHGGDDDTTSILQLSPTWDARSSVSSLGSMHSLHSIAGGAAGDEGNMPTIDEDSSGQAPSLPNRREESGSRAPVVSPRLFDRNALSLFDKLASSMSLNRHSGSSATSPSAFFKDSDSNSPRLPSTSITELSTRMIENFSNAAPPVSPRPQSLTAPGKTLTNLRNVSSGLSLLNRAHAESTTSLNTAKWDHDSRLLDGLTLSEAKHQKIVNDILSNNNNLSNHYPHPKPAVLSPRNPIVDASCFYGTNNISHHNFDLLSGATLSKKSSTMKTETKPGPEVRPPALSPRNCATKTSSELEVDRTTKPAHIRNNSESSIVVAPDEDPPLILPRCSRLSNAQDFPIPETIGSHNVGTIQRDRNRPPTPPERPPTISPRFGKSQKDASDQGDPPTPSPKALVGPDIVGQFVGPPKMLPPLSPPSRLPLPPLSPPGRAPAPPLTPPGRPPPLQNPPERPPPQSPFGKTPSHSEHGSLQPVERPPITSPSVPERSSAASAEPSQSIIHEWPSPFSQLEWISIPIQSGPEHPSNTNPSPPGRPPTINQCSDGSLKIDQCLPELPPTNNLAPELLPDRNFVPEWSPTSKSAPERAPINNSEPEGILTSTSASEWTPIDNTAPERPPTNNTVPERLSTINSTLERPTTINTAPERPPTSKSLSERLPTSYSTSERSTSNTVLEGSPTSNLAPERPPNRSSAPERPPVVNQSVLDRPTMSQFAPERPPSTSHPFPFRLPPPPHSPPTRPPPPLPHSPHVNVPGGEHYDGDTNFNFSPIPAELHVMSALPRESSPTTAALALLPAHTPPPLPPRRRVEGAPQVPPRGASPPPLPTRPSSSVQLPITAMLPPLIPPPPTLAPPTLLRPAHSALMQRRHCAKTPQLNRVTSPGGTAKRLPPKPPHLPPPPPPPTALMPRP